MGFDDGSDSKKGSKPSVYVSRPSGMAVAASFLLLFRTAYVSMNFYWKIFNCVGEVTQWYATAIGKNEGNCLTFVLQL
jgi:hypothetical protein